MDTALRLSIPAIRPSYLAPMCLATPVPKSQEILRLQNPTLRTMSKVGDTRLLQSLVPFAQVSLTLVAYPIGQALFFDHSPTSLSKTKVRKLQNTMCARDGVWGSQDPKSPRISASFLKLLCYAMPPFQVKKD